MAIVWLLLSIYGIVVVLGLTSLFQRQRLKRGEELAHDHILLEIIVSKNSEEEQRGPLAAEQVFSSLHSIYQKRNSVSRWFGDVQPRISIEIANFGDLIRFYVWIRSDLKELFESQLYAQYPDIEIYERKDYGETLTQKKSLISAKLSLQEPYVYPIKKYRQFEDAIAKKTYDSLSGIVSSLSKLHQAEDKAVVQIIFSPLADNWHKAGLRHIQLASNASSFASKMRLAFLQWSMQNELLLKGITILLFPFAILRNVIRAFLPKDSSALDELEKIQRGEEIRDDTIKNSMLGKIAKLGFKVAIRIVYATDNADMRAAESKVREIAGSFKQFNLPHLNGFKIVSTNRNRQLILSAALNRAMDPAFILNAEELASVFHLPISTIEVHNIAVITSKTLAPPQKVPLLTAGNPEVTPLGESNFRDQRKPFGMKREDRRRHLYIIGKTGMGKSTLLENMIYADIQNGNGLAVIDPHGDLAEKAMSFVPAKRTNDVIVFDPSDVQYPLAFNMIEQVSPEQRNLVASGLVGVFKKLYADSWGPRLEYILRNTILSLLEYPNSTMLAIMRILTDDDFREKVVAKVSDPLVKNFWVSEYNKMSDKQRIEAISPIQNKVGQFLSSSIIRNILGQPKSAFQIRWAMDNKKIVIVNLSKGKIGEDNSALLGSMFVTRFQLDAMSRADMAEKDRNDFYLYVDEFQNFATNAFATILSEARKYRLNLVIANQYIAQMPEEVRDAVFGNVGSMVSFQVGFDDAEYLQSQFNEEILPKDLLQLPRGFVYLKMLVDNMPTNTFSANTFPPMKVENADLQKDKVQKVSRERYGKSREIVEDKIRRWAESMGQEKEEPVKKPARK